MTRIILLRTLAFVGLLTVALVVAGAGVPVISFFARGLAVLLVLGALLWGFSRVYQAVLWRVGRRLAFSYFLIGVLPIPMILFLAAGTAYVLATFFLGHLYRDEMDLFQKQQVESAEAVLEAFASRGEPLDGKMDLFAYDYYLDGEWVGGAGVAPETFPAWLTAGPEDREERAGAGGAGDEAGSGNGEGAGEAAGTAPETPPGDGAPSRLVANEEGRPTLALGVERGRWALTSVYTGDLGASLRRGEDIWVELLRQEETEAETKVVTFGNRRMEFQDIRDDDDPYLRAVAAEREAFLTSPRASGRFLPVVLPVNWSETAGTLHRLEDGEVVSREVLAQVASTPALVTARLYSTSSQQDADLWLALGAAAGVLLLLYGVAVIVALFMIGGLSGAVNRLSRATEGVQHGDFSMRIPVRRKDQLGDLQRSFNEMTANLEGLVATATQKEILEKELNIARELQESLLPRDLPQGEAVEFATLFEPSAAIGGDYFDILRVDDTRMAVMIADVSGHGLSSGLRMAMIKAALQILVDDFRPPREILARLDELVRGSGRQRFFVTATLSLVDLVEGRLEITNAGHTPTYLLRGGQVREILLPSSPLGTLGRTYTTESFDLEDGDMVVWLSDGFIEAVDARDEPFGFDAVVRTLSGPAERAVEVRDRLREAVETHLGGASADDDCTLVVMSYRGRREAGEGGAEGESAGAGGKEEKKE